MYKYLILMLFSILFISCGEKPPEEFTPGQKKSLSYIPYDAQFVLYANLSEMRNSELGQGLLKSSFKSGGSEWLSDFEKETGAGLSKGVTEVFTSSSWNGNNIVAVVFEKDAAGIVKYFENEEKFTPSLMEGKTVYSLNSNPVTKFYFPDSTTLLVVKDDDYLLKIISGEQESINNNKEFLAILNNINLKKHYWMASNQGNFAMTLVSLLVPGKNLSANKLVKSIDNISLAAEIYDDVQVESVVQCKDDKSAYLLSAAIRSALAMDLFSESSSSLSDILDKIDIERTSKRLNVEITLNKDDILQLRDISQKRLMDKKL